MTKPDLYGALGVDKAADASAVQRAFRKKAKAAHPDAGGSPDAFALVCLAKDVLSDAERRARYDRTGDVDGGGPDQTESNAMQVVMSAITQVAERAAKRGRIEEFDIVADAVRLVRESIAKMQEQSAQAKANAATTRKLAKRFRAKKGKANKIAPMFEAQAAMLDGQAERYLADVPAHELALKILADHSFETDQTYSPFGSHASVLGGVYT